MPCAVHLVSLQGSAGVEAHFAEFVRHAASRHPNWEHIWLNPAGPMHSLIRETLADGLSGSYDVKRRGFVKLPAVPKWFRAANCRRLCKQVGATVGVVWNRTARSAFFLDALGDENVVHWEHGRVWHAGRERDRQKYLDRIALAIANSHAAKRVLELRWGFSGEIRVCLNALRPSLRPASPLVKPYPAGRRVRLGTVARLLPVKGVPLVLHAFRQLLNDAVDAELHIAGDGPDRNRLESLAAELGISSRVRFHGIVRDMASFYTSIDCLVHLPLTEAFGLVGLEAAAHGCPVVAAAVDGLAEAVRDGVSGRCLSPSLPLSAYAGFGSSTDDVPPEVYDPVTDRMQATRLVDPSDVARALRDVVTVPRTFESLSRTGAERVYRDFDFEKHVDEVLQVLDSVS